MTSGPLQGMKQNLLGRYNFRVDEAADVVTEKVTAVLLPQLEELRGILGDQADAASEAAAAFGRVLARLSAEVETLAADVARLHDRLDDLQSPVPHS